MTKTIIVTGATDGIGLETARKLMTQNHNVIIHGRSKDKTEKKILFLEKKTKKTAIPVWGNLARMREVTQLAQQILDLSIEINVLINNAGVFCNERRITEDGFEETMAINHYSIFLLTNKIFDTMQSSKKNRIVTVSSMAHQGASIELNNLEFESGFSGFKAYATSKLANILFTKSLAKKAGKYGPTANSLHPGVISTKLLHSGFDIKGDKVEKGAETSVYLATSSSVNNVSGKYFINCKEHQSSKESCDPTLAEDLWDISLEKLRSFL